MKIEIKTKEEYIWILKDMGLRSRNLNFKNQIEDELLSLSQELK